MKSYQDHNTEGQTAMLVDDTGQPDVLWEEYVGFHGEILLSKRYRSVVSFRRTSILEVPNTSLSFHIGILNLRTGAFPYVATDIYNIDAVGHVDCALMHVVEHLLRDLSPDSIVDAAAEEADADDDVASECNALLHFQELVLEACDSAEVYDEVFADHG